jgi:hypothetical protein
MNTYNVTLSYEDRTGGPEGRTIKVDASNIAGAIGKATREFVKSLAGCGKFGLGEQILSSIASFCGSETVFA